MKLIHRSERAREAVRTTSPGGEAFVAIVVGLMLIAVLGDVLGPAALGELEMEIALFDMGGEGVVLAIQHWSLLEMMMAAAAIVGGISFFRSEFGELARTLVSAASRGLGKIPI